MSGKRIFCIFLFVLLAGCSFEPENTRDMLLYAHKNYAESPGKVLTVYKKFGKEGEEALIRVFFAIAPQGQPYYDAEIKKTFGAGNTPIREMVSKLSEDAAFLRAILDISAKYRQIPADLSASEYIWVLRHDKALFQAWVNKDIALNSPRLADVWKTYFATLPEEAFTDSFKLLERYLAETGPYANTLPWLEAELASYKKKNRKAAVPQEWFRFVFVNNLIENLFTEWQLTRHEWMQRHPEDFGLALWQKSPRGMPAHFRYPLYEEEFPRSAVKPTQTGDKVILFYDRTKARYGLPKVDKTLISVEPQRMRDLLPRNVIAESLANYDKQIVLALTPVPVARYTIMRQKGNQLVPDPSHTVQGIRWKMTVTYSVLATGKVLAKKEFLGPKPPESKQTTGRVEYIAGNIPWREVNEYIKSLFPNQPVAGNR